MFRVLCLVFSVVFTVGMIAWMGPLFLVACLALVVIVFAFSMKVDPRNELVRTPRPSSFKTSYMGDL